MAKRNPTPAQFSDVAAVLDAALRRGGGRYALPDHGLAVRWRQRAYTLRKLLMKQDADRKPPGVSPTTPYDSMILRIHDDEPTIVKIEILQPTGVLTDLDGKVIEPKKITDLVNDPFQEEADALAKSLL